MTFVLGTLGKVYGSSEIIINHFVICYLNSCKRHSHLLETLWSSFTIRYLSSAYDASPCNNHKARQVVDVEPLLCFQLAKPGNCSCDSLLLIELVKKI
jgi:hypothetical protein